jgi:hypothetical protein
MINIITVKHGAILYRTSVVYKTAELSRKMEVHGCLLLIVFPPLSWNMYEFSRIQILNLDINFKFQIFIFILFKVC